MLQFFSQVLGIPLLVALLPSRLGLSISYFESVLLFLASVVASYMVRDGHRTWVRNRNARKLGAVVPPIVKGKWPGNIDVIIESNKRFFNEPPGTFARELYEKLDSTTVGIGILSSAPMYMSSDPMIIKHVLTGETFHRYEKGELFNSFFTDFLGSGIFNSDREQWKHHRTLTRPYFAKERTTDFDCFSRHSKHLLTVIEDLQSSNDSGKMFGQGAIDIQDLFGRFTLDSAIQFLMGGTLTSLSEVENGKSGQANEFLNAFNQVQHNCYARSRKGDLWPLFELFENKNDKPMKVLTRLVDGVCQEALAKPKMDKSDTTLLDHMIRETRDPKELRDEVLNILLAARDTTMATLTCSINMLASHPEILSKLREEILAQCPDSDATATPPTYEEILSMKYLRAFLNEILRMFPPVPFNMRSTIEEDVIINEKGVPLYVPPATRVSYSLITLQRRKDLFGPDADKFDPTRWLSGDPRASYMKKNPFIFTPFSAGARTCLGQQFAHNHYKLIYYSVTAYNETSFVLIQLLRTYAGISFAKDLQPKNSYDVKTGELLLVTQITLMMKGGLWVRLQKAAQK